MYHSSGILIIDKANCTGHNAILVVLRKKILTTNKPRFLGNFPVYHRSAPSENNGMGKQRRLVYS